MPIQMALRPKARICGAYPAIGYGRINVFGHSQNKKKWMVIKNIEGVKGKTFSHYADEFDYLVNSGIAVEVKAVSNPVFPLIETSSKNLIKGMCCQIREK